STNVVTCGGSCQERTYAWIPAWSTTPGSPQTRFTIAKRSEIFGRRDFFDLIKDMQQFNCSDVVGRIRAPTLVMETELEQFYPNLALGPYFSIYTCSRLERPHLEHSIRTTSSLPDQVAKDDRAERA